MTLNILYIVAWLYWGGSSVAWAFVAPGSHSTTKLSWRTRPVRMATSIMATTKISPLPTGKSPQQQAPRALTIDQLQALERDKYVIIPNFLTESQQDALRADVQALRQKQQFNVAKIGQDDTNRLNTAVRVAETCFWGPGISDKEYTNQARQQLHGILNQHVRQDLMTLMHSHNGSGKDSLDAGLTELLYAYYPTGGFYRTHTDALPGSASALRKYSLLLYLNQEWTEADGGQLRMYVGGSDKSGSGGEEQNANQKHGDNHPPSDYSYHDVLPTGGTLVLFDSAAIPHEVLDTQRERLAVVGWYNRPVDGLADAVTTLGAAPQQVIGLGVAVVLVTIGVVQLVMGI